MDAHAAESVLLGKPMVAGPLDRIVRATVVAWTWLLLLIGLFLLVRRLSGALEAPLTPSLLLTLGALAALAAWSARAAWRGASSNNLSAGASGLFVRFAPSIALLSIAIALSLPGSEVITLALFWALLLSSELETHFQLRRRSVDSWRWACRFSPGRQAGAKGLSQRHGQLKNGDWLPDDHGNPENQEPTRVPVPLFQHDDHGKDGEHDENIVQQLTRVRDAELGEMVYGTLRADFEPNQRSVSLHVAFCPPLAMVPQMDIEQTGGPEARLKLGQVLPYGARVDVRLREAFDQPQSVVVELCVREKKTTST